MAFIQKRIQLPDLESKNYDSEMNEALLNYTTKLADIINGGLVIDENVKGLPGTAVADATGAGDIVAQFNKLLASLRALDIIDT